MAFPIPFLGAGLAACLGVAISAGDPGEAWSPEIHVVEILRRSREPGAPAPEVLAAELAAPGAAVLPAALDLFETRSVPPLDPEQLPQVLSEPQAGILLGALSRLDRPLVRGSVLARLDASREPAVRQAAIDVLGAIGGPRDIHTLFEQAQIEGEEAIPASMESSLQRACTRLLLREPRAYEFLRTLLREIPEDLAPVLIMAVGEARDSRGLEFLGEVGTWSSDLERMALAQVLRVGRSSSAEVNAWVAESIRPRLDSSRMEHAAEVILALGELRDPLAVPRLIELLADESRTVRENSLWALRRISGLALPAQAAAWQNWHRQELDWRRSKLPSCLRDLDSRDADRALMALEAIRVRRLGRDELAGYVAEALWHESEAVRVGACRALQDLGTPVALSDLVEALSDPDAAVADAAWAALSGIHGEPMPPEALQARAAYSGR